MKLHFAYFCIAFTIIPLAMGTDLNRSVRGLESSPKSGKKKDTKGMGSNEKKSKSSKSAQGKGKWASYPTPASGKGVTTSEPTYGKGKGNSTLTKEPTYEPTYGKGKGKGEIQPSKEPTYEPTYGKGKGKGTPEPTHGKRESRIKNRENSHSVHSVLCKLIIHVRI
jgi:hypothetical protein